MIELLNRKKKGEIKRGGNEPKTIFCSQPLPSTSRKFIPVGFFSELPHTVILDAANNSACVSEHVSKHNKATAK
jgi:hypothetical protein